MTSIFNSTLIKCGSTIRIQHLATKRNLHSHHFQSPISHNQEVSAFGEDGVGDDLDEWSPVCSTKYWERKEIIRFKHRETQVWVFMHAKIWFLNGILEWFSIRKLSSKNTARAHFFMCSLSPMWLTSSTCFGHLAQSLTLKSLCMTCQAYFWNELFNALVISLWSSKVTQQSSRNVQYFCW